MAKLNFQLQLDKEKDIEILELIQSYTVSYNLMTRLSLSLKPMTTVICDNSDGTIDFRLIDFEFEPKEWIQDSDKAAEEFLNTMGISREDIISKFNYTGEPKYED